MKWRIKNQSKFQIRLFFFFFSFIIFFFFASSSCFKMCAASLQAVQVRWFRISSETGPPQSHNMFDEGEKVLTIFTLDSRRATHSVSLFLHSFYTLFSLPSFYFFDLFFFFHFLVRQRVVVVVVVVVVKIGGIESHVHIATRVRRLWLQPWNEK